MKKIIVSIKLLISGCASAESISKAFEIFKSIFTFNKGINYVYSWLIFTLAII